MNDATPPYRTIVFDCDSTLSAIEGIDELARRAGDDVARATEEATALAMAGEIALEDVYGERLDRIRPDAEAVDALGERYVECALPHATELVAALAALEKRVCIVSGGLLPAVRQLAAAIGVAPADVFAVDLTHDAAGSYAGFESGSPLARSGGKIEIVRALSQESGPVCVVGDGTTDLETAPVAARFIAFGGVERRAAVFAQAAVHCEARDLAALVPLVLGQDEIERLHDAPAHAALLAAARPWVEAR